MKVAFFNNQGGETRLSFYSGIAKELQGFRGDLEPIVVVWGERELDVAKSFGAKEVLVFETWVTKNLNAQKVNFDHLTQKYENVDWGEVIATERSFTDFSLLLGSSGDRRESIDYVKKLMIRIISFYEFLIQKFGISAFVMPTADTLFTLTGYKVASHFDIPIISESPAWIIPDEMSGAGFFCSDEFMHSPRMEMKYAELKERSLTDLEVESATSIKNSILHFGGHTKFSKSTKGADAGQRSISPNWKGFLKYISQNFCYDKEIFYMKFEVREKVRANLLRFFRKILNKRNLNTIALRDIDEKSVFFALQFQPEQSTLTQANWFANQIYVIECIARSLPLGYRLIVKEHPWGRGNRPTWQYKHISRFYNVELCDSPAREIIKKVAAVIALPGTVALESIVIGRPTILFGGAFYDFSTLLHKVTDVSQMPHLLKKILLHGEGDFEGGRETEVLKLLVAYREALIPGFPTRENAKLYARQLVKELSLINC